MCADSSSGDTSSELVSIGVPVRNGGAMLRDALDSLLAQTHRNIEVIVSDNASTDETAAICREYRERDARVRYVRQNTPLEVMDNFRACFEHGRGEWWMFAAHDDLRTPNYVETLLRGARSSPGVVLSFTDASFFSDRKTRTPTRRIEGRELQPDVPHGAPALERHASVLRSLFYGGVTQFYGLMRREPLLRYSWAAPRFGPDVVMIHYLAERGELRYEPGATFLYFQAGGLTSEGGAAYKKHGFFGADVTAWTIAKAVARERGDAALLSRFRLETALFLRMGSMLHGGPEGGPLGWAKYYVGRVYWMVPAMHQPWRALKRRWPRIGADA